MHQTANRHDLSNLLTLILFQTGGDLLILSFSALNSLVLY
jgi:hypothetical protein